MNKVIIFCIIVGLAIASTHILFSSMAKIRSGENAVQSSAEETVVSSDAKTETSTSTATQAEPENFESSSKGTDSDQSTTADSTASTDETTAQADTEQEQPATEEKSDDDLRTDMTGSETTVKMIDLEGMISSLEAQLKTHTPRLPRIKQLLQQAREDLKVARAAYVASDEDSADRLERMVKRAGCEFERACDIAEVKLSSFE